MCFRITDSPSIDSEKHTYDDGSAVEGRHFLSRDYLRDARFRVFFASLKPFCTVLCMASIRRKKHGGK